MDYKASVDMLFDGNNVTDEMLKELICTTDESLVSYLTKRADEMRRIQYGKNVYLRGLIEISSYCKNDCLYCGIRCSNKDAQRYRLTAEDIMKCCEMGYSLGYRTFVLQGGEDSFFDDDYLVRVITDVKNRYADCAVTLSLGERSFESYRRLKEAGADRYLLRQEAADEELYGRLHPSWMSLENRKKCLFELKELGFQVGCGFMVGAPSQTVENIISDLRFMQELMPSMIGIGPFIPHHATPFSKEKAGTLEETLRLVSILRLMFHKALIPSTTSLGTISPMGRELGLQAGANVVMPNLSPVDVRKKYELYDNKICTGEEAAECRVCLENRIKNAGYQIKESRGDVRL